MSVSSAVSSAVAVRDNVLAYRDEFAVVLPSHVKPDTWVRLALGALRRNSDLADAARETPGSLINALLDAARLGLEPGSEQYYLTPRKTKGHNEVLGIVGYRGKVELMYRAGAVSSVICEVVRAKDIFRYVPGRDERPVHEIDWDVEDRGPLRLAYAYAVMKDGATSKVVVLNKHHIKTAKASSQGSDGPYSPWVKHEEAMWMKTAIHRLEKWVPTSAEYRTTLQDAAAAALGVSERNNLPALPPAGVDLDTGEVGTAGDDEPVDAELVDNAWPDTAPVPA